MQMMLIFSETAAETARRTHPEEAGPYWAGWTSFIGEMQRAGVMLSGNGLQAPHTATRVQVAEGRTLVQDGPYADSKEALGGYVILEVPDLDTAIAWAAKAPCAAAGSVEIRPVLPPPAA
jgi:hypothetical protein